MIGQTLGNRYLIEENIGVGGMAVVYKAKDKLLNRYVAIKVLKDEFMDDEEFLKKFAMEAQSAASLSHNNIVSVYDVGNAVVNDQRYNYIVMEYIDGRTLKDVINNEAPLGAEFVANIGFQIASALEAAHKKGVVHRDIKPHNILLDKDNVAGMNVRKATEKLAEVGLKYNIEETASSTIDKGVVISQSVDNGVMVKKGSVINLQVSTGEKEKPSEEAAESNTNKKTTSYTFRVRVADISPGAYNVRIERIVGDKEVNVYNRQLDTARGDANITINVRRGESYNVYVNDELYSGETIE